MKISNFLKNKTIKKVVLVAPPMKLEQVWGKMTDMGEVSPPLALCYLAAYIREKGIDVSIIDAEVNKYNQDETVAAIIEEQPDFVGFTCKTLWVKNAFKVARQLKEANPEIITIAGGHHPTALPEKTLADFPSFDILVLGEGEITLFELIDSINKRKEISSIKGLAFMDNGMFHKTDPRERIKKLDTIPMPALDLIPSLEKHYPASLFYNIKGASFPLMTSRGCTGKCRFCDKSIYRNRVTFHSPEYSMSLIENLYRNHNVRYLVISDDNFLLKKSHLLKLLDMLKKSKMKIRYSCQGRVDTVDEEKIRKLKETGCEQLIFGIETGSQVMLDKMNKGVTVEKMENAIKIVKKAKLSVGGFFLLGYPGETEETLKETVDFIFRNRFDDIVCSFFTPLPGSEIYNEIDKHGKFNEDFDVHNTAGPEAFVPGNLTTGLLSEYSKKYYSACYTRGYQLRTIPRRIPTWRHFKVIAKSFFTSY